MQRKYTTHTVLFTDFAIIAAITFSTCISFKGHSEDGNQQYHLGSCYSISVDLLASFGNDSLCDCVTLYDWT